MIIKIPTAEITGWASFHDVFQRVLGFPSFYGRNMDAWIDCMTGVDGDAGMTSVTVPPGDVLILEIEDPFDFKERLPEQYDALIECSSFVNHRRTEVGDPPVLALLLNGQPQR